MDNYQSEGVRKISFLTENVITYHHTISAYLNELIGAGFILKAVMEPMPSNEMLKNDVALKDENRRSMFLIISAEKEK